MNNEKLEQRTERAGTEPLVISQVNGSFRVYSATKPGTTYMVSGSPEAPACTCPDFERHRSEPGFSCKHILAVLNQFDPLAVEERKAIQTEGQSKDKNDAPAKANGTPQMVLKRSVSPDGRIDSLSVEFACPIDQVTAGEIKSRALHTLKLQSEIVQSFLDTRKNGNGHHVEAGGNGNGDGSVSETDGSVSAKMINIGGLDGQWGRRLFINFQFNGNNAKLFGTRKQLAAALTTAGYPDIAANVAEGMQLNLPCRIATKPSEDGRFLNVEKVFPVAAPQQRGAQR